MHAGRFTVSVRNGAITTADQVLDEWLGGEKATTKNIDDLFHLPENRSVFLELQSLIEKNGIQYLKVLPDFQYKQFENYLLFTDLNSDLEEDLLDLDVFPVNFNTAFGDKIPQDPSTEILNTITDFILLCAPDYTILSANKAAQSVYGGNVDLEGRKCFDVMRGKDAPCEDCPLPQTLRTGKMVPLDYYEPDLGEFLETRTYPRSDTQQAFAGFLLANRVTSHRKKQEMESTQDKKLQALGQMASGIAHDFNNMLTIILGRLQLLKLSIQDEDLLQNLKTIEKAALDSSENIHRLQDFTRKRQEESESFLEPVQLNHLIEDVVEYAKTRTARLEKQKGIHIEIESRLGKISLIEGNKSALRNALLNLIFNAIDALDVGGLITIWSAEVGERIEIGIADTGIGMSQEVKEKIFDPFFTTKGEKGNGLGLSEVYGVVNQHGAYIEVESNPGEGSTFTLYFPSRSYEEMS